MLIRSLSERWIFAVLLLMATPALSLSGLIGLGFFPNEKLALILVAVSVYAWSRESRQLRIFGLSCATVLSLLFYFQFVAGAVGDVRASLNYIAVLLSIPLYYSFLSARPGSVCRWIFFIGVLQFFISIVQQYFSLVGQHEVASYFNNYPAQSDYRFPVGETGFIYRTSGLFFESSGYAVFQWLAIFCAKKIELHKNSIARVIIFLMIVEVLLNGSLTGYIFAVTYLGIDFFIGSYRKIRLVKTLAILPFLFGLFYLLSVYEYFSIANLGAKISGQFDFLFDSSNSQPSRLRGLFESFAFMAKGDSWIHGVGFSWITPTLDFYSLNFKAFGLIGFIFLSLYVLALIRRAPLNYGVSVVMVLSVNGHLSTAINILLLAMPLVFLKMERFQK